MTPADKTWTGGAHIGGIFGLHAFWPFAKLSASKEAIVIDIRFEQTYIFEADKVISIEPYGIIPFIRTGIRIHHKVQMYPQKVIFWVIGSTAEPLLDQLRDLDYYCVNK
jgi:hypothetical protein